MDAVQRWLTLVTLVSAALAALLYLARQGWRLFKLLELLSSIVQHELSPNTGNSMKDDVAAIAVAVGKLQSDVSDLTLEKTAAHGQLQLQLDSIHHELGHATPGLHRQATHKREDDET